MNKKTKSGRHQGRIYRFHFACHAGLPHGTTLRVTSSVGPPPQNDVPDDGNGGDDQSGIFSADGATNGSGGNLQATGAGDGGIVSNLAKMHNRLLQNTVEMYTTPEMYPIWKTKKPVVVVDDGGREEDTSFAALSSSVGSLGLSGVGDGTAGSTGANTTSEQQELTSGIPNELIHRYRYVAVTPGATIDWSLCLKKDHEDDGSSSIGRGTAATTPPGSDDEREDDEDDDHHGDHGEHGMHSHRDSSPSSEGEEKLLHLDGDVDDEPVYQYPPVLYEHPTQPQMDVDEDGNAPSGINNDDTNDNDNDIYNMNSAGESTKEGAKESHHRHKRSHSLFDSQGNPIVLNTTTTTPSHIAASNPPFVFSGSVPPSTSTSQASFASYTTANTDAYRTPQILTWEGVSALPYRTRRVDTTDVKGGKGTSQDVEIVDHWNEPADPSFQYYWETKRLEQLNQLKLKNESANEEDGAIMTTMVTKEDNEMVPSHNEDDDPMDATDNEEDYQRESIYLVCFHLPVILTRDPENATWTACWSESLIAKTETYGVSSTRKTKWVGTVSSIPMMFLEDKVEREKIKEVLEGMDCIPIFFGEEMIAPSENTTSSQQQPSDGMGNDSIVDKMYLGFCKQVLWPSFHNVDLLDLATNGWGQRQRTTRMADPVAACALAEKEAKERKRSESFSGGGKSGKTKDETNIAEDEALLPRLQSDWDQSRLDSWWNAYIEVNRKFSDVVAELVSGGDIVWVHDYHLALLPRMLREARNEIEVSVGGKKTTTPMQHEKLGKSDGSGEVGHDAQNKPIRMVFFIHVPFPTSQVFRELEHGEALLEGMLHADIVGFHAFDHARHFLNAAKRILGLTYESLVGGLIGVRHHGTKVLVTVSNVSVETDIVEALLAFPSVQNEAEAIQTKHEGRSIIAGIAVAQRLSGVSLKLLAFERLLTDYPVWQSKVVLLQRCLIAGTRRVDEADTLREVRSLVQRIRVKFGPQVIDYEEQVGSVLPIDQRLAIWTSSQVVMHTPIREGLNLCPLEYVFARKEPVDPGVVIASEFSAVSSILNGALRVNPFDIQMCVTSLDCALSMSLNERDARRSRDIDFVSNCPSGLWTRNVLRDLNDATLESKKMDAVGDSSPDSILAREVELGLEILDMHALELAYSESQNRVIVIDFNGTLVVKEPPGKYLKREILGTSGFKPSNHTIMALCKLCSDPRNTVYVVSGDSQQNLEVAVGNIPGLGLAASNGACFADPVFNLASGQERVWQYLNFGVDWDAVKKVAMPIISKYTARTNGSFVKLTHSSIGWSYYSCDPEWGSLQASHLVPELESALRSFDVRFVALKGIVEVVPRQLHKGQIVKKILEDAQKDGVGVDFALCIGDDISDEKMFTSVISFSSESIENSYAFNVAVGKKPTNASFFVDDASDVADILMRLSGEEIHRLRTLSSDESCAASVEFFS